MKILHVISGALSGGAARGAYWLHLGLRELGVESSILTNSRHDFEDNNVLSTVQTQKDKYINIIREQLDNSMAWCYPQRQRILFSSGCVGFDFTNTQEYKKADIIHLHWINGGFVNIKHLAKIDKPIVWTLRDMWPMTGGCHYTMGCENFKSGCGNCKQLNSHFDHDLSRFILKRKIKYLPKTTIIVGVSNWISEEARKSQLFREFDIRIIYNSINIKDFFPIDKNTAKEILGIRTDKKIILTGTTNASDFYKGFNKYLEAMRELDKEKYFLCFFGNIDLHLINQLGFEYKYFGYLYDAIALRLAYSASNCFVAPSLMEAFGKTLAESMACGTPVVAFAATGPLDIVDHKQNGYLAKPFDSIALAKGIEWITNTPDYDMIAKKGRQKILDKFVASKVASQYLEVYETILKK